MYKVVKFKHNNEFDLTDKINQFMEDNPDHSLVTMTSIDNRGKMFGILFLTFVTFKDNSLGGSFI